MFLANVIFFLSAVDTDEDFHIGVALSLCAVILHCIVWSAFFSLDIIFCQRTLCARAAIPILN